MVKRQGWFEQKAGTQWLGLRCDMRQLMAARPSVPDKRDVRCLYGKLEIAVRGQQQYPKSRRVNIYRAMMRLLWRPPVSIVSVSKHLIGAALEQEVENREPLVHVAPLVGGVPEPEEQHRLAAEPPTYMVRVKPRSSGTGNCQQLGRTSAARRWKGRTKMMRQSAWLKLASASSLSSIPVGPLPQIKTRT